MNSIGLITKTKITAEKVSQTLLDNFAFSKNVSQNDEHELFVGKIPNNFYIVFDDSLSLNDDKCMLSKEDLEHISFEEGYYNCLFFHNIEIAKYVVKTLSEIYTELIVIDENDFTGLAKDYLEI